MCLCIASSPFPDTLLFYQAQWACTVTQPETKLATSMLSMRKGAGLVTMFWSFIPSALFRSRTSFCDLRRQNLSFMQGQRVLSTTKLLKFHPSSSCKQLSWTASTNQAMRVHEVFRCEGLWCRTLRICQRTTRKLPAVLYFQQLQAVRQLSYLLIHAIHKLVQMLFPILCNFRCVVSCQITICSSYARHDRSIHSGVKNLPKICFGAPTT